MTRLHDLYAQEGQSPWLDNIRRGWITSGELARWVESGIRGLTSNPSNKAALLLIAPSPTHGRSPTLTPSNTS